MGEINKIHTHLAKFVKRWREGKQINKIRDERGTTTNTDKIHRFIITHFKNLHSIKLGNLNEMSESLDICNLPKLSQNEINNQIHNL